MGEYNKKGQMAAKKRASYKIVEYFLTSQYLFRILIILSQYCNLYNFYLFKVKNKFIYYTIAK